MKQEPDFGEMEQTWKRLTRRMNEQSWPSGCLYVVATPIGNLGDLGLRAWQALLRCDAIAAEDTRSSRALLDAWGVRTPLMAAHRHNENAAAGAIIQRLQLGQRVALISDAGAPAVSDPGARIVRQVAAAGYRVVPVPGPSAVIAALMASGVTSDETPGYAFAGFPPAKALARRKWLQGWAGRDEPVVLFESPHRVRACIEDLLRVCGPERRLTIARELSKRFEQIHALGLGDALGWLDEDSHRCQGEFVLILHPAEPSAGGPGEVLSSEHVRLMEALLEELSVRDAVRIGVRATGLPRDTLYAWALQRPGR